MFGAPLGTIAPGGPPPGPLALPDGPGWSGGGLGSWALGSCAMGGWGGPAGTVTPPPAGGTGISATLRYAPGELPDPPPVPVVTWQAKRGGNLGLVHDFATATFATLASVAQQYGPTTGPFVAADGTTDYIATVADTPAFVWLDGDYAPTFSDAARGYAVIREAGALIEMAGGSMVGGGSGGGGVILPPPGDPPAFPATILLLDAVPDVASGAPAAGKALIEPW